MKSIGLSVAIVLALLFACMTPTVYAKELNLPDSAMSVPWADFQKLLEKLEKAGDPVKEPDPPYDGVITTANYNAVVKGKVVDIRVDATVILLKTKGWVSVPIINKGTAILSAELDGKPISLVASDGMITLVAKGAGVHNLKLVMQVPVHQNAGPESFTLPVIKSPVNKLNVSIGRPGLKIFSSSNEPLVSKDDGKGTIATGSFTGDYSPTISWVKRAPKVEKDEARLQAEVKTRLTVGEGRAIYFSIFETEVMHKPVNAFELLLPAEVTVSSVNTQGLADWRIEKDDSGMQKLTVTLSFEVEGRHIINVGYEEPLEDSESKEYLAKTPQVAGAAHEIGYLAVGVMTNVEVTPLYETIENMSKLDPAELPHQLKGGGAVKILYGYKYFKHPSRITLKVVKHEDAAVLSCEVEQAEYDVMITKSGKQIIQGVFRIVNRSRQYMKLSLPEGSDLWGVYRDGRPVKAASKDGDILLPIYSRDSSEKINLKILAYKKGKRFFGAGNYNVELPVLDVGAGVTLLKTHLPDYDYAGFRGNLEHFGPPVDNDLKRTFSRTLEQGVVINGKSADKLDGWNKDQDEGFVNIPQSNAAFVALENNEYSGTIQRGVLPVIFNFQMRGNQIRFEGNIIDPGEELNVSFFYYPKKLKSKFRLVLLLVSIIAGFYYSGRFLASRIEQLKGPATFTKSALIIVSTVFALGCLLVGNFLSFVIGGLAIGVSSAVIRLWLKSGTEIEKPVIEKTEDTPVENEENTEGGEK